VKKMSKVNLPSFREKLYDIGRANTPQYIWEWFFRYLSLGPSAISHEPPELLKNYDSLISMAIALLEHKYTSGTYSKIIYDVQTPQSTYYFIGDTHGSFDDTYQVINYFIQAFQVRAEMKIIWIGDYIDRNPLDFQNLALILSFWILFPENVFLLRGNHEDGSVCSRYGFSEHLYIKAGSREVFLPIWEKLLKFFSMLPLGIVSLIGSKKVCVFHGGFPFDLENFRIWKIIEIEPLLNCFQKEHFDMDPNSQAILWADPDEFLPSGVQPNPRSGRPRYSKDALTQFLDSNQFDCMIRGHSKWDNGYKLFFDNRLISLFSTSKYDNKPIGQAKFLRLTPDFQINEIEDELTKKGKGILTIEAEFLQEAFEKYYK
jgi:predicted phosphodiesterase